MSNFISLKGTSVFVPTPTDGNIQASADFVKFDKLYLSEFPSLIKVEDPSKNVDGGLQNDVNYRGQIKAMIKYEQYPSSNVDYFDLVQDAGTSLLDVLKSKYLWVQRIDGSLYPRLASSENLQVAVTNVSEIERVAGLYRIEITFETTDFI